VHGTARRASDGDMRGERSRREVTRAAACWLKALVPALIFAGSLFAQHRVFTPLDSSVVEDSVQELSALADWCRSERLYCRQQRVLAFVLELDPDNVPARRKLGYHRIGGEWKQSSGWRAARDYRPAAIPEAQRRVRELLVPLRQPFLEDLQAHPEGLRRESAQRTIRALLELDPDDAVLRAMIGETRFEGEWVLVESARTVVRRKSLAADIAKAREHAPSALDQPVPEELADWPVNWSVSVRTLGLELVGTVPKDEGRTVAADLQSLARTFELAFGVPGKHRDGLRVMLFTGYGERDVALNQLDLPPTVRRHLGSAAGGWLGSGQRLAEWDGSVQRRRDGAARQVLGTMLMDRFGIDGGHAWAWEGLGLYLIHLQLGTRGTWFYQGSGYQPVADALSWSMAQDPASDWHALTRVLLTDPNGLQVHFLLGRPLNSMTSQDLVCSYTLAAYLLEGWPDRAPQLLTALGRGEHPVLAFERELGFPITTIDQRIVRWIDESQALCAGLRTDGKPRDKSPTGSRESKRETAER